MWLNESPDDDGAAEGVAADDGIGDAEVADAVFVCGPPGMPEAMLGMLLSSSTGVVGVNPPDAARGRSHAIRR